MYMRENSGSPFFFRVKTVGVPNTGGPENSKPSRMSSLCGRHEMCSHVTTSNDILVDTRGGGIGTKTYYLGLTGWKYQSIFPPLDTIAGEGEPCERMLSESSLSLL